MSNIPNQVVKALVPSPLPELLVKTKARSATLWLRSLGIWSYLHPNRGHGSILVRLQQLDSLINIGVILIRLDFNFEPRLRSQCWLGNNDWLIDCIIDYMWADSDPKSLSQNHAFQAHRLSHYLLPQHVHRPNTALQHAGQKFRSAPFGNDEPKSTS
jgi:hypothetical protein